MKNKRLPLFLTAAFFLLVSALFAQPAFINPIPIPPVIDADSGVIELDMAPSLNGGYDSLNGNGQQGIVSWCYNIAGDTAMTYLGPTLRWHTGDSVHIVVNNLLPDSTTTHWHGASIVWPGIRTGGFVPFLKLNFEPGGQPGWSR